MEDLLLALQKELEWAREGTPRPKGEPYLSWDVTKDWSGSAQLTFSSDTADTTAIVLDGRLFFGDELRELQKPNYLPDLNPQYVAFRVVDSDSGKRQSFVVMRSDAAPPRDEVVNAIGSAIYDPDAARIRASAHAAIVTSSQSTRARSGRD